MARFDTRGLDGVLREMKAQEQLAGPAADAMLMDGAEQVKEAWRKSAQEHRHRRTSTMINSIGYPNRPKTTDGVKSIDIYPKGTDSSGRHAKHPVRNAAKAFYLHYGTSRLQASGWVDEADKYGEKMAIPAMISAWENYKK